MGNIHRLKTLPLFFKALGEGKKNFEVRKNDRYFSIGDELLLQEFVPENYHTNGEPEYYTGDILLKVITYILDGGQFGIEKGYVVLGLK